MLKVQVERTADTAASEEARLAGRLRQAIKDYVGVSTEIVVGDPGTVPRSEGKAVRAIDDREERDRS